MMRKLSCGENELLCTPPLHAEFPVSDVTPAAPRLDPFQRRGLQGRGENDWVIIMSSSLRPQTNLCAQLQGWRVELSLCALQHSLIGCRQQIRTRVSRGRVNISWFRTANRVLREAVGGCAVGPADAKVRDAGALDLHHGTAGKALLLAHTSAHPSPPHMFCRSRHLEETAA